MTEAMIVEAVKGAQLNGVAPIEQMPQIADPTAVDRFNEAMLPDPIPFAQGLSDVWHAAQDNRQGILHRIKALSEMRESHSLTIAEMSELQYEVANLSFQQEVVAKVADKASNAIQTLIKNQ